MRKYSNIKLLIYKRKTVKFNNLFVKFTQKCNWLEASTKEGKHNVISVWKSIRKYDDVVAENFLFIPFCFSHSFYF